MPDVVTESEFSDDRLVRVYDTLNSYEPDTQPEFYPRVAAEIGARSVLEIGCGTGLISHQFIQSGYAFTGLEPSRPMLDRARQRPGAKSAHWIYGGVEELDLLDVDFAFMAGHVAQFFLTDEAWSSALDSIRAVLRPGGCLAFETRSPLAREWDTWAAQWRQTAIDPVAGRISTWTELREVTGELVFYTLHYEFHQSGMEIQVPGCLRFRSLDQIRRSLDGAGFEITGVLGDWDGRPFDDRSTEIIVIAIRK